MLTRRQMILAAGAALGRFALPARADDWITNQTQPRPSGRPAKVDLWKSQSPLKDQLDRGTCIAHSTVAALEAAYIRAGHDGIDLSEEFTIYAIKMFWLEPKPTPRPFTTENKPGFLSGGFGSGYVAYLANGFAVPTEELMPYHKKFPEEPARNLITGKQAPLPTQWYSQYEVDRFNLNPERFDAVKFSKATFHSVSGYQAISAKDPDQIEAALAAGREVVWDFDVPESATSSSKWKVDPKNAKTVGGHSVLIVGYDRTDPENPVFHVKNSWKGIQKVTATYEFVRRFGDEAAVITGVHEPRKWEELAGLGRWYLTIGDRKGLLDVYHVPGMAKTNFEHLGVRGEDGKPAVDRRLGTFFLDGDPFKAFRVNGLLHKDGVSVEIDWDSPNQRFDATGTPVRLKFAGAGKGEMTGTDARAVRVTSKEAFGGKVPFDEWPEVKKED
jgi:hypothetical protein